MKTRLEKLQERIARIERLGRMFTRQSAREFARDMRVKHDAPRQIETTNRKPE